MLRRRASGEYPYIGACSGGHSNPLRVENSSDLNGHLVIMRRSDACIQGIHNVEIVL